MRMCEISFLWRTEYIPWGLKFISTRRHVISFISYDHEFVFPRSLLLNHVNEISGISSWALMKPTVSETAWKKMHFEGLQSKSGINTISFIISFQLSMSVYLSFLCRATTSAKENLKKRKRDKNAIKILKLSSPTEKRLFSLQVTQACEIQSNLY